jgi:alkylation response protein AidB-like acyl-CoA dehydrogenase
MGVSQTFRLQDSLSHDIILPDEVEDTREEVRSFARNEVEPIAWELDQAEESVDSFPHELFSKMGEEGLFQIPFSEKYGGQGLEYPVCNTAVTMEELAYASNSIAAVYDVQCMLTGHALSAYGSEQLKKNYLEPLIFGEKIGCFATTEPGASNDLRPETIQTTAEKSGNTWIINGQKRFISNSPVGDFVITLCETEDTLSEILIDLDQDGVEVGVPDKKMGNRAQLTADIHFDSVEVSETNTVGDIGHGLRVALGALVFGRIGIGATGVGMAQAAFDETVSYLKERDAFGGKIAELQYPQFKLAEFATQIENARNLASKAAYRHDQGQEFPEPHAAMAKYYGTKTAGDMARYAVQAHGGRGFMQKLEAENKTFKVERIYRNCKITEIYEGANEIQKHLIAQQILGEEFVR